jgi:hypothetical protein
MPTVRNKKESSVNDETHHAADEKEQRTGQKEHERLKLKREDKSPSLILC